MSSVRSKCVDCDGDFPLGMSSCPNCGSRKRQLILEESLPISDMLTVLLKAAAGYKRFKKRLKQGTKTAGESKRPAKETLLIDKSRNRKFHLVEEQREDGEWEIVHFED